MVEVDQEQRLDRLATGAPLVALPLILVADEILEIASIVERRERIAAALERELAVLFPEEPVRRAKLPVEHGDDRERNAEQSGE